MKKILSSLIILISINAIGQNIDTIYVRNLSLRAEEWYWLKGNWSPTSEDDKKVWKKMRTKLVADAPPNNSTMVTIDSIPGRLARTFYTTFMSTSKAETGFMTNNISQNIRAYTPMVVFCDREDTKYQDRFQNARKNGRDDFDN